MLLVIECPDRKINVTELGISSGDKRLELKDLTSEEKERLWMVSVIITDGKIALDAGSRYLSQPL